MTSRVLVAGIGNDLCQDDGFGIVLARRLAAIQLPPSVQVVESGIGGIGLVQDLMDGYDTVVILDAVDRGSAPGTLFLLETQVPDLASLPEESRQAFLADMHYTVPSRALTLAQALGVLPSRVFILGCQPLEYGLGLGLSEPVQRAVDQAIHRLLRFLETLDTQAAPA